MISITDYCQDDSLYSTLCFKSLGSPLTCEPQQSESDGSGEGYHDDEDDDDEELGCSSDEDIECSCGEQSCCEDSVSCYDDSASCYEDENVGMRQSCEELHIQNTFPKVQSPPRTQTNIQSNNNQQRIQSTPTLKPRIQHPAPIFSSKSPYCSFSKTFSKKNLFHSYTKSSKTLDYISHRNSNLTNGSFIKKKLSPQDSCDSCTSICSGSSPIHHEVDRAQEIRQALNIRITSTEYTKGSSITYVVRIVDVATGNRWCVRKRFREFYALYKKLLRSGSNPSKPSFCGTLSKLGKLHFPRKSIYGHKEDVVKQRKYHLDSFLRHIASLVSPSPIGPRRKKALLLLQDFLFVNQHVYPLTLNMDEPCKYKFCLSEHGFEDYFSMPDFIGTVECKNCIQYCETIGNSIDSSTARLFIAKLYERMLVIANMVIQDEKKNLRMEETWKSDDIFRDFHGRLLARIELAIFVPLEDMIHNILRLIVPLEQENQLKKKIHFLQSKSQGYFGIPVDMQSKNDWEDARREMKKMDGCTLPFDKLQCIVNAANAVFKSFSFDGKECDIFCADNFLSIHIFVLVTSNLTSPLATQVLISNMCDSRRLTGEVGYFLTMYEAAIEYVSNLEEDYVHVTDDQVMHS